MANSVLQQISLIQTSFNGLQLSKMKKYIPYMSLP